MKRVILTILLLSFRAAAFEAPEDVDRPGFDVSLHVGIAQEPRCELPYPFVLTVDNKDEDFDGVLEVELVGRTVAHEIELPANSKKRYRFALDVDQSMSATFRLREGKTVFWQKTIKLPDEAMARKDIRVLSLTSELKPVQLRTATTSVWFDQQDPISPMNGRQVTSFPTHSWALPETMAPLKFYHAVMFLDLSQTKGLSEAQLRALAQFVVQGGAVICGEGKEDLIDRILDRSPFPNRRDWQPVAEGVDRMPHGAGRFLRCNAPGAALPPQQQSVIVSELHVLHEPAFPQHIGLSWSAIPHRTRLSRRGGMSILAIATVFLLYTVLVGPIAFVFRRKKKALAIYIVTAISFFTFLAILVGAYLRFRDGELTWITVTEMTPDGGIQEGVLSLKSVGGSRHGIIVDGTSPYLWVPDQYEYLDNTRSSLNISTSYLLTHNTATDQLHPLSTEEPQLNRLDVPLSPWGTKYTFANAYCPQMRPFRTSVRQTSPSTYEITIYNHLDTALKDASILSGAAIAGMNPVYRRQYIQEIPPRHERRFPVYIYTPQRPAVSNRQRELTIPSESNDSGGGQVRMPEITVQQPFFAVLCVRVPDSPGLTINDESDFNVAPGVHYLLQRIPPTP